MKAKNETCLFFLPGVICTGHFCAERGFAAEVRDLSAKLVSCTRRLWQLTKVYFSASSVFVTSRIS